MGFYIGQLVIHVGSKGTPRPVGYWEAWQREWKVKLPTRGKIYTIRDTRISAKCGRQFVRLEEIINPIIEFNDAPPQEYWFRSWSFRPLSDTHRRIVRDLLQPLPKREDVPA